MRSTGDPITAALGGRLPADQLAERIHEAGYDRPLLVQYLEYLGQICAPATSARRITDSRPVAEVLTTFGAATLELAVLRAARRLHRRHPARPARRLHARQVARTPACGSSRSSATRPRSFFAGLLLKLIFSVWLGWLPGRRPGVHRHRDPAVDAADTRPAST